MHHRLLNITIAKLLLLTLTVPSAVALTLQEPPYLNAAIDAGQLPSIVERLPTIPYVTEYHDSTNKPGQYGGRLRTLMGKVKDIRMMTVYGYARLVGYDPNLNFQADILESYDIEEFRRFTLHLRQGHKWSDGHPFTSEDFRFYWQDVARNKSLSPFGPPKELWVGDELPKVEIIDETTVRYSWSKPNHLFLNALAGARPLYIYKPAHYLKNFHQDYADAKQLKTHVDTMGVKDWTGVFLRQSNLYKYNNPDLPVLQPWINTTQPPAEYFVFKRNPYFHRIDENGLQLPYIDEVAIKIASGSLIPAKTGTGESDLQARNLRLDNFTFLKEGEQRNGYDVRLWGQAKGSQVAIYPNLTTHNLTWRPLIRDIRFRRALSLAINRREINQVIYFGLAKEAANSTLPDSEFGAYQDPWSRFDIERANQLLDDMGYTEYDDQGFRLITAIDDQGQATGEQIPMELVIHSAGESTEESDILELIADSWKNIGIKLLTKPSQRDVFRQRVTSGDAVISVWSGMDNSLVNRFTPPSEFVPYEKSQLQWPDWGHYIETNGMSGFVPDDPKVMQLISLYKAWKQAENEQMLSSIWQDILSIYNENLYSIGTVNKTPVPVVVNKALNNVPEEGIYAWAPYSYFGVYRMDTFWFNAPRNQQQFRDNP